MSRLPFAILLACATACATAPQARRFPERTLAARSADAVARARALRAAGNVAAAEGWLEAALALDPKSAAARLDMADLLVATGGDAERAGVLLAGLPEGDALRDDVLGRLAELRADPRAAEAAYARSLAVRDDPDVRLRRALLLEALDRRAEVIPELERVRAARPDEAAARVKLAERYEEAGQVAETEAELRWLAEHADRPEPWRRLAAFLARHGQGSRARAAEAKAAELEPQQAKRSLRPLLPSSR
jgi:thioredoxin-like negative regulator of GroEL